MTREHSSHFRLASLHEQKSQWKYQAVNGIALHVGAVVLDRTFVVFSGHELALIRMRVESLTALRAQRPSALGASIKAGFARFRRQSFMTAEADWMRKHFWTMDDGELSEENFAWF